MTYYDRGGVRVDGDFARFGTKSYAIDKISSLDMRETVLRKAGAGPVWIILAAVGALMLAGQQPLAGVGALIFAGVIWYAQRDRPERCRYDFVFVTGGGETMAYQTEDAEQAVEVRTAIEAAMVGRKVAQAA